MKSPIMNSLASEDKVRQAKAPSCQRWNWLGQPSNNAASADLDSILLFKLCTMAYLRWMPARGRDGYLASLLNHAGI
jgi:hypothetical protein